MMEGTHLFTGSIVELRDRPEGRVGRVSVRGAVVDVALDLVPDAQVGDGVLVHAGVALSIVGDDGARGE